MAGKIETASAFNASSVPDSPPQVSAWERPSASPVGSQLRGVPPQSGVGEGRHSSDLTLLTRVCRIQREIEACRPVSDADLLQHARDLTGLMEQAYAAYEATRNEFALEHAKKRMTQRDAARRLLSPEFREKYEIVTFWDLADQHGKGRAA